MGCLIFGVVWLVCISISVVLGLSKGALGFSSCPAPQPSAQSDDNPPPSVLAQAPRSGGGTSLVRFPGLATSAPEASASDVSRTQGAGDAGEWGLSLCSVPSALAVQRRMGRAASGSAPELVVNPLHAPEPRHGSRFADSITTTTMRMLGQFARPVAGAPVGAKPGTSVDVKNHLSGGFGKPRSRRPDNASSFISPRKLLSGTLRDASALRL
jgi:hypothetical protein